MKRTVLYAAHICLGLFAGSACADGTGGHDIRGGRLSVSGYYTVDLTAADGDTNLVSTSGNFRRFDDGVVDGRNSIAGLQLSYDFNDDWSATIQGAAYFDRDDDATSDLQWAYLARDVGDNATLRAGRFRIPFMRGTELRNVGYTRLWARPLVPGAGAGGFNRYDGVELIKRLNAGAHSWYFQFAAGVPEHDLARIDGERIGLLAGAFEGESLWMRLSAFNADFTARQPRAASGPRDGEVTMGSVELSFDLAPWIIHAGYVDGSGRRVPDDGMAYLSLGRRAGRFTPYVLAAEYTQSFDAAPSAAPPGRPDTPARADRNSQRRAYALGLRWDVRENLAVKFQYEDVSGEQFSPMSLNREALDGGSITIQVEGVFR